MIHLALLRGINVGKGKRVPMAELKVLFDQLGYQRVSTLLNSGNVVFQGDPAPLANQAEAIAKALKSHFQFEVPVIVKSADDLNRMIDENSLLSPVSDHSLLLAIFTQSASTLATLKELEPLVNPPEQLFLGDHGAYLSCSPSIHESRAGKALLGRKGEVVTTRNWATVLKLQALVQTLT